VAAGLLSAEHPDAGTFRRRSPWRSGRSAASYSFAFYLLEQYVSPAYPFAGLSSFIRYGVRRR
jgi:hypothetical protein